jgi:hypothetical protein
MRHQHPSTKILECLNFLNLIRKLRTKFKNIKKLARHKLPSAAVVFFDEAAAAVDDVAGAFAGKNSNKQNIVPMLHLCF